VNRVLYGAFVWARGALNRPKRRFPARAVDMGRLVGLAAAGALRTRVGAPRSRPARAMLGARSDEFPNSAFISETTMRPGPTVRLEITGPRFGSLGGKL
jgi:hypothetical protein